MEGCVTRWRGVSLVDSTLTKCTREEGVVTMVSSPSSQKNRKKGLVNGLVWKYYTREGVTFSEPSVTSRALVFTT